MNQACPRCRRGLIFGWCTRCGFYRRLLLSLTAGIVLPVIGYSSCRLGGGQVGLFMFIAGIGGLSGSIACLLYGWWRDRAAIRAWRAKNPNFLPWRRPVTLLAPLGVGMVVAMVPWSLMLPVFTPGEYTGLLSTVLSFGFALGAAIELVFHIRYRDDVEQIWVETRIAMKEKGSATAGQDD